MDLKEEILNTKNEVKNIKEQYNKNNNFDLGNEFRKIIYFLCVIIVILLGIIIFFVIKNNNMAKELSEFTCETDIMEQDGLYNFIDSEGNMISTDVDVLNKYIEEYYGKAKENK